VVRATWEQFTHGFTAHDLALVAAFRDACRALPETEMRVSRTEVRFARERTFAVAFIAAHRLELAIDLLREASHPLLLQAFPTTKKVVTHRLSLERLDQFDDSITSLLTEAWETVGPGTRAS